MRSLREVSKAHDRNVPRKPGLVGGVKGPQYEMKLPYREAPACARELHSNVKEGHHDEVGPKSSNDYRGIQRNGQTDGPYVRRSWG